jgi:uncharacterized repeat protein (TIGR01451 family)
MSRPPRKWFGQNFFAASPSRQSKTGKPSDRARRCRLRVELLEHRFLPTGTITGLVFQDFNGNGVFDTTSSIQNAGQGTIGVAVDRGIGGLTVTAYDNANVVQGTTTTSLTNGTFTINAGGIGPYRVEFTNFPAGFLSGPHGPNSGTSVQFVPDGNSNIQLGINNPLDYSQNNPDLVTSCYVFGDPINGEFRNSPVIISFPYSAGTQDSDTSIPNITNPDTHALAVPARLVGTTWGLAYNQTSRTVYAAAYMKKHAGFGPNGTGAIYQMGTTGNSATLFADLNAIFGSGTAGTDPHDTSNYINDNFNQTWDAAGKVSLGGMTISEDGRRLYVMNLANRTLYEIPLDSPISAGNIRHVAVPLASVPHATGEGGNDIRPFGVTYYRGQLYVGMVNSAESTQSSSDLWAYVYRVDPTTLTFDSTPAFLFQLNYPRGVVFSILGGGGPAAWLPWKPTYGNIAGSTNNGGWLIYPQPMLTKISFDVNGNMVLGLKDRLGDQSGNLAPEDPQHPDNFLYGMSGGDTLRAFINTPGNLNSGWTLENNGRGPHGEGGGPQNTDKGPGGAQYYFQSNFADVHDYVTLGGLVQVPGFPDIVTTVFNPNRNNRDDFFSGGTRWFNNAVGNNDKSYELFSESGINFGKASGVGDLVPLRNPAPIEIGNRLWKDLNHNGIQDAAEPAFAGVTVGLYDAAGTTLIATALTDAGGNYYFSSAQGISTPSERYGLNLQPNTAYQIKIDMTQPALGGYGLTIDHADHTPNGFLRDSDAVLVGTTGVIFFSTGGSGDNNHTYDAGFVPGADLGVVKTVNNATPNVGDVITFTVTLTNHGPADATNIVVRDQVPSDVTFISATTSRGTYNATTGIWSIASLPNQAQATLTMTVHVNNCHQFTNFVTIVSADQFDPNPDNNSFQVTVTPFSQLSGIVFSDLNNNGIRDVGEPPIPGVLLTLTGVTNSGQQVTRTTRTGADGSYIFLSLLPGNYSLKETQPAGYFSGRNSVGTVDGVPDGMLGINKDVITNIDLTRGGCGFNYNFADLPPGCIRGNVFVDLDRDGIPQPDDIRIPGVVMTLTGTNDLEDPVLTVETTDVHGTYAFCNLRPGTYKVTEGPTPAFEEGTNHVGTLGGRLVPIDMIADIPMTPAANGLNYDFSEGPLTAESISKGLFLSSSTIGSIMGNPPPPLWSYWHPLGPNFLVTGSDAGGLPAVQISDTRTGAPLFRFNAYDPAFRGGVRVAVADINCDGIPDIITAAGPGGGPHVKVFDGATGEEIFSFMAYAPNITTGVYVAAGDVNGDGYADIVTGTGLGSAPHVKAFSGRNPAVVLDSFFAYQTNFFGGVRVAVGDVNGDGFDDIITGAGPGGGPHVKVISGRDNTVLQSFFAYDASFLGGVYVAAGDVTGNGRAAIITGSGQSSHVKVFDGDNLRVLASFFAYDLSFMGGVRVGAVLVTGSSRAAIVTGAGPGGGPHVKVFDPLTLTLLDSFFALDPTFTGGVFVGGATTQH